MKYGESCTAGDFTYSFVPTTCTNQPDSCRHAMCECDLTLGGCQIGPNSPHVDFDRCGIENGPKSPHTGFDLSGIRNGPNSPHYVFYMQKTIKSDIFSWNFYF